MAIPKAAASGDVPEARIVRAQLSSEIQGFLLTKDYAAVDYFAHYVDALVEEIDPPAGTPRPDPDPAVRTKRVAVPSNLQNANIASTEPASKYTGQMRRVVQCRYGKGLDSVFSASFTKSHGIVEYPNPRVVGGTTAEELTNLALRRFWLVEITANGCYAAPINMGRNCASCASNLRDYQATATSAIDLYASYTADPTGAVLRLLDSTQMADVYTGAGGVAGNTFGAASALAGWAFSASGHQASVCTVRDRTIQHTTDVGAITFDMTYKEFRQATVVFSVALVEGVHTISASLSTTTHKKVPYAEHLSNVVFLESTRRVSFLTSPSVTTRYGTVPAIGDIVFCTPRIIPDSDIPVHVFYDGDTQILTKWYWVRTPETENETTEESSPDHDNGDGSTTTVEGWFESGGTVAKAHTTKTGEDTIPLVQSPGSITYDVGTFGATETRTTTVLHHYGFYNSLIDGRIQSYEITTVTYVTALNGDNDVDVTEDASDTSWPLEGGGTGTGRRRFTTTNDTATCTVTSEATTNILGASSLVLFGHEREAVGVIKKERTNRIADGRSVRTGTTSQFAIREQGELISGAGPFTDYDYQTLYHPNLSKNLGSAVLSSLATADSGTLAFVGPQGYSKTHNFVFSGGSATATDADLAKLFNQNRDGVTPPVRDLGFAVTITPGLASVGNFASIDPALSAAPSLNIKAGGLKYVDPFLDPTDQRANRVVMFDTVEELNGGFATMAGRSDVSFIGQS